jgi:hypothetical protein
LPPIERPGQFRHKVYISSDLRTGPPQASDSLGELCYRKTTGSSPVQNQHNLPVFISKARKLPKVSQPVNHGSYSQRRRGNYESNIAGLGQCCHYTLYWIERKRRKVNHYQISGRSSGRY